MSKALGICSNLVTYCENSKPFKTGIGVGGAFLFSVGGLSLMTHTDSVELPFKQWQGWNALSQLGKTTSSVCLGMGAALLLGFAVMSVKKDKPIPIRKAVDLNIPLEDRECVSTGITTNDKGFCVLSFQILRERVLHFFTLETNKKPDQWTVQPETDYFAGIQHIHPDAILLTRVEKKFRKDKETAQFEFLKNNECYLLGLSRITRDTFEYRLLSKNHRDEESSTMVILSRTSEMEPQLTHEQIYALIQKDLPYSTLVSELERNCCSKDFLQEYCDKLMDGEVLLLGIGKQSRSEIHYKLAYKKEGRVSLFNVKNATPLSQDQFFTIVNSKHPHATFITQVEFGRRNDRLPPYFEFLEPHEFSLLGTCLINSTQKVHRLIHAKEESFHSLSFETSENEETSMRSLALEKVVEAKSDGKLISEMELKFREDQNVLLPFFGQLEAGEFFSLGISIESQTKREVRVGIKTTNGLHLHFLIPFEKSETSEVTDEILIKAVKKSYPYASLKKIMID